MDPTDVISMLPRLVENTATIHLLFKIRLQYQSSILHKTVRSKVTYDLAKYLIDNSVLYKQEGMTLDTTLDEKSSFTKTETIWKTC